MFGNLTIADNCSVSHELAGSDLEWLRLVVAHLTLFLKVSSPSRGNGLISFVGLRYVDCPMKLHKVCLRLATELEWEAVRLRLPLVGIGSVGRDHCLVIDGHEGRALLVASVVFVSWDVKEKLDLLQLESDTPLWEGGPLLSRL